MALDTYDNLKQEIIDFSHREDIDLKVDTFIKLAETEMYNNPVNVLNTRGQESRSTAVTSGRYLELPPGYQSMRKLILSLNSNQSDLRMRAPEQMISHDVSGIPRFFTVTSQIEFDRTPDAEYDVEMQFYALPTPLSSSNQTNIVLTNTPNIYLFGALWALNEYAEEEVKAAKYYSRFMSAISGANKNNRAGRYGPAPAMRIEGATP